MELKIVIKKKTVISSIVKVPFSKNISRIQKFIGYFFQSNCGGYGINGVGQDFGGFFSLILTNSH